jgi:hypothetical protein
MSNATSEWVQWNEIVYAYLGSMPDSGPTIATKSFRIGFILKYLMNFCHLREIQIFMGYLPQLAAIQLKVWGNR